MYQIFTDTDTDLTPEKAAEYGYKMISMPYSENGADEVYPYVDFETFDYHTFYDTLRKGVIPQTFALSPQKYIDYFEPYFKEGKDILYLGFSSGLSTTYNSARIAANELKEKYPDSKVIVIDTLGASAGIGLLVRLVLDKKDAGATIEEAADYAKELIPGLCHWFTVDDLVYLKRGGRVSAAAAFFGNMIGIKPVLHVDDEGHLVPVLKVRGRRTSLTTIADKYGELAKDKKNGLVYISQAACENDAKALADILNARYGAEVKIITDVGPVIGAHAGPGTIALFFIGTSR